MIRIFRTKDRARLEAFATELRQRSTGGDPDVNKVVSNVLAAVRGRGDPALVEYNEEFDGLKMNASQLKVSRETLKQLAANVDKRVLEVIRESIKNVTAFHEHQREQSWIT